MSVRSKDACEPSGELLRQLVVAARRLGWQISIAMTGPGWVRVTFVTDRESAARDRP